MSLRSATKSEFQPSLTYRARTYLKTEYQKRGGDAVQLVRHLPCMHEALGSILNPHEWGIVPNTCNGSTGEVEAEVILSCREFETSLGCRPNLACGLVSVVENPQSLL